MLKNVSKKKNIIEKVKYADSPFKRFKGLMFEKKEKFDYALIFDLQKERKQSASIHMCFVFFPIDVFFLNAKKQVVDKVSLKPWTLNYTPKEKARYIIELPAMTGKGTEEGDEINW